MAGGSGEEQAISLYLPQGGECCTGARGPICRLGTETVTQEQVLGATDMQGSATQSQGQTESQERFEGKLSDDTKITTQ